LAKTIGPWAISTRGNFVTHDFSGNYESFEPLIGFLRFLVQKLWPKQLNLGKNYLKDFYPKFWLYYPNFWTRKFRNLIKGLKDQDFSLISTKNLSEILPSYSWGPGPTNHLIYDITQKNLKTFQIFLLQTKRLAESFDGLNSSLAQPTGELWSCKVAQKLGLNAGFPSIIYSYTSTKGVNVAHDRSIIVTLRCNSNITC